MSHRDHTLQDFRDNQAWWHAMRSTRADEVQETPAPQNPELQRITDDLTNTLAKKLDVAVEELRKPLPADRTIVLQKPPQDVCDLCGYPRSKHNVGHAFVPKE